MRRIRFAASLIAILAMPVGAPATGLGLRLDLQSQSETTVLGAESIEHRGITQAAGDLTGDGIPDLVVGTRGEFRPFVIDILAGPIAPGVRDLAAAPGDVRLVSSTVGPGGHPDVAFAVVEDLDADGAPDLAFATFSLPDPAAPGRSSFVRVLYGPLTPGTHSLESRTDLLITGSSNDMSFLGWHLAVADLDADGLTDLLLPEHRAHGETTGGGGVLDAGRVHVLYGPLGRGMRDLGAIPADVLILGDEPESFLGHAVAAGDLSGDGVADLAISSPGANAGAGLPDGGRIDIVRGPFPRGTRRRLADEPGETRIFGATASDRIGLALAIADLSGDGRPDLAIGSYEVNGNAGRLDVVRGPLPAVHATLLPTSVHARVEGAPDDRLGFEIVPADVDGDGATDLIVGAMGAAGGCGDGRTGVAHVFHGPMEPGTRPVGDASDVAIAGWHDVQDCGYVTFVEDLDGDGQVELGVTCGRTDVAGIDEAGSFHLVDVSAAVDSATAPCCDAGGPYVVPCSALEDPCGGSPVLDGTGSIDPLGGPLTYSWSISCGSFAHLASGPAPTACAPMLPGRPCFVSLTVTNSRGESSSCATTIELERDDTTPPTLAGVPPDARADCDAVPAAADPTATDDCGPARVDFAELREDGTCPDSYRLTRTWTATDAAGNVATASQFVEVVDETPPALAGVPADARVACDAVPGPAPVTASDACDPAPSLAFAEARMDGPCPGSYRLERTWTATDSCSNVAAAGHAIDVVDDVPPAVVAGDRVVARLWPPDHRPHCFDLADLGPVTVTEACSDPVSVRVASCDSDEPEDGLGDGAFSGDCVVLGGGESFCVRAERSGTRRGRTYSVSVVATDACGNESAPTVVGIVRVPHDAHGR